MERTGMNRLSRLVIVALLFPVIPAVAMAQSGAGAIGGTAQDASGALLPGVTVTLVNPGTIGGNQVAVTDARGTYQFSRLVPGTYSVRGELEGFRTIVHENVVVNADVTSRVDVTLAIGDLAETLTVVGQSALVDTTQALNQTVMDNKVVASLPSRNDIWAIARVVPSVVMNKYEVGGTESYQNSRAWVHGAGRNEGMLSVDGMNISCFGAAGASPCTFLDPMTFQEVNFQTGNTSADSVAGGVSYNMVTRTGTNVFRGSFASSGTNHNLQWSNITPELRQDLLSSVSPKVLALNPGLDPGASVLKMYNLSGYVSGPLLADRIWWVATGDFGQLDQQFLGSYNAAGQQTIDDNERRAYSAKVSWQMAPGHQLHFFGTRVQKMQFHASENKPTQLFDESTLVRNAPNTKYIEQLRWTGAPSPKALLEVGASHLHGTQSSLPQPEINPGDIARFDRVTLLNSGSRPTYSDSPGYRNFINSSLSYAAGAHYLKVGWQYDGGLAISHTFSMSNYPSGLLAIYRNGVPDSVNTYNTPTDSYSTHVTQALYAQDRWSPFRKLTINYGLRLQTARGGVPAGCTVATVFFPVSQCFPEIKDQPDFMDLAPRFAVIYDVSGNGRTAIKLSANRYIVGTGTPYTTRINPRRTTNDTRAWVDANNDLIPQLEELGPSSGIDFGNSNSYAAGIKNPISNEFSLTLEHELPRGLAVSVATVVHQVRRVIGSKNLLVPPESYTPITVTERSSGQSVTVYNQAAALRNQVQTVWDNYPGLNEDYKGIEINLRKRMSNHWMFFGGVNYGSTKVDINTGDIYNTADLNNPNFAFRRGPSALDVPLQIKGSGQVELPYGLALSGSFQHFTGFPENTTVSVGSDTVALTQVTQVVLVSPSGTTRLPAVNLTDLSLRRSFTHGKYRIEPVMDLFNLGNINTTQSRITQLGPTYGRTLGIVRGRMIKFGINVDF